MTKSYRRGGFTLTELLVVISIIATLATLTVFTIAGAQEDALETRAEAQIDRITRYLEDRWEEYYVRRLPFKYTTFEPSPNRSLVQQLQNQSIVEMIRCEFPYQRIQLETFPSANFENAYANADVHFRSPAKRDRIGRLVGFGAQNANQDFDTSLSTWTAEHQQAECLYLILATTSDLGEPGTKILRESEVGDTDNDGIPEVLDPWGEPLAFHTNINSDATGIIGDDPQPKLFEQLGFVIRSRNLEISKGLSKQAPFPQ